MAASPQFKIYTRDKEYIASCKEPEDAAAIVALRGNGSSIIWQHSVVVWNEGREQQAADISYDFVAQIVHKRIYEYQQKILARRAKEKSQSLPR